MLSLHHQATLCTLNIVFAFSLTHLLTGGSVNIVRVFVCLSVCQLPVLSTLQYSQVSNILDSDKTQTLGWLQLPAEHCTDKVLFPTVPLPREKPTQQPPALILTTSGPPSGDANYLGPLSSEMKYPDTHAVSTRASFRCTQHAGTGLRDLYSMVPVSSSTAGSLRRKSTNTGRPREPMTSSSRHVGLPPSECSRKHDRTAECDLEYRV